MKNEVFQQKIDLVKFQILSLLLSSLSLIIFIFFTFYFLPPFVLRYFYTNNEVQASNFFFYLNNGVLLLGTTYFLSFIFLLIKRKRELNFWLKKQKDFLISSENKESELLSQIEEKINQIIDKKLHEESK
jgi:hypothetical protein